MATATEREGRGRLARALAIAEASQDLEAPARLLLLRGEPTEREQLRAAGAGATFGPVCAGCPVLVDLPEPHEVAGSIDPARLVVMDDTERFAGEAAIVVQPSAPTWSGLARASRVLAGWAYAAVGRRVSGLAGRSAESIGSREGAPRVLVCFGGSDQADVTGRIAPALAAEAGWQTEVVLGPGYAGRWEGLRDPADLPERLAASDLAVLGGGTLKFEGAALGRPMLLVAAADDQLRVGPAFAEGGAARWLGDGRTIDPAAVVKAVRDLLADTDGRARLGTRAREMVDGRGAERIAEAAMALW